MTEPSSAEFLLFALVNIAAAYLATLLALKYALSTGLLDIPNSRSSHYAPTARGGGVAIVIVTLSSIIFLCTRYPASTRELVTLFAAGSLIASTGFLDDRYGLPARLRIVIHSIGAAIVVLGVGAVPVSLNSSSAVLVTAVATTGTGLALVWATNLYNFMDGIDGIACVQGIAISAITVAVLDPGISPAIPAMFMALGAGCTGFLFLNWTPARIFMGDVGSGFLGLMYGALLVWATVDFGLSIWTASIVPAVFVADASITLLRRMMRGDEWYSAHRTHAYQHVARRFKSHAKVSVGVGMVNAGLILPAAYFSERNEDLAPWIALVVYIVLGIVAIGFRAGQPENP